MRAGVYLSPVVLSLLVVETLPLHTVLRSDLAEVGIDDSGILAGSKKTLIGTGSEVELALCLEQRIDAH